MSKPTDRQLKLTALAVGELSVEEAEELLQSLTPVEAAQLDADRETAAMLMSDISQSLQSALSPEHHESIEAVLAELDSQIVAQPSAKVVPIKRARQWLRPFATVLVSAAALLVAVVVSEVGVRERIYDFESTEVIASSPTPKSTSVRPPPTSELAPPKPPPPAPQRTEGKRGRTSPNWHERSNTSVHVQRPSSGTGKSAPRGLVADSRPMGSPVRNAPQSVPNSVSPGAGGGRGIRSRRAPRRPAPPRRVQIQENDFQSVERHPVTTIAIDVDTAAYSNIRRQIHQHRMPDPTGVRIEEFVNYFSYDLPQPQGEHPIAVVADVTDAPWNPKHLLARVALNTSRAQKSDRKRANIVLLVDVSGSMAQRNKLPLLKVALRRLAYSFTANDRVAIVTYSDKASVVLPSVPGNMTETIIEAIDRLKTGGSTNGALGLKRAYEVANKHHFSEGTNRVVIATDGDFNVGQTKQGELTEMVRSASHRAVFMTVLGFGDDLKDSFLERLADRSDGHYAMIDTEREADRVLGQQLMSTLQVVAKDVKVQLELNPRRIAKYRLIGYENRKLDNADFNDDGVDGGEMGAGHAVTMLYELVPRSTGPAVPATERVYQTESTPKEVDVQNDLLMVNVRYKTPDGMESKFLRRSVHAWKEHLKASHDTRFAAAVAGFGLLLINSQHKGDLTYGDVIELAKGARGEDPGSWRNQFVDLVKRTQRLQRQKRARPNPPYRTPPRAGVTQSEIQRLIRDKKAAASRCYQDALNAGGPRPSGKIELELDLHQARCEARVITPRFRKTKVGECLRKIFRGHCQIGYQRNEKVVVPFLLQPQSNPPQPALQAPITTVTGTTRPQKLSEADILQVLRSRRANIAECRNQQAKADPSLDGKMTVGFIVKKNGEPTRISVSPDKFVDSVAGRCIVAAVSTWRFAEFTGPSMPVDFPVVIRSGP